MSYHGDIGQYEFANEEIDNVKAVCVDGRFELLFSHAGVGHKILVEDAHELTKDDIHQGKSLRW